MLTKGRWAIILKIITCLSWGKCCNYEMNWQLVWKIGGRGKITVWWKLFLSRGMARVLVESHLSTLSRTVWYLYQVLQVILHQGQELSRGWNSVPYSTLKCFCMTPLQLFPLLGQDKKKSCFQVPLFTEYFFFFNWSIVVDLQCCVSFRCTAKWIGYTYILHPFFFRFFSILKGYWI